MRKPLSQLLSMVGAVVVLSACGGGSPPPETNAAPNKAEKKNKGKKPKKAAKADKKTPAKTDGKKEAGKKEDTEKAAAKTTAGRPPFNGAKPGTLNFRGDKDFTESAEKIAAESKIFDAVMKLRKFRKPRSPALLLDIQSAEGLSRKFIESLKAKGIDTDELKGRKVAWEMAKESGTAVVIMTIEASEGVGADNKVLAEEKWEAETTVMGDSADARTAVELEEAFQEAKKKAASEKLVLAMDSMALTLIKIEGVNARKLLPDLRILAKDPNELIKNKASEAIANISEVVHKNAMAAVKSENKVARESGLEDLLLEDPMPEETLAVVIELLKDPEYTVRATAALALVEKRPQTPGLPEVLCETLADRNSENATGAKAGLVKLGPAVAPMLVQKLVDPRLAKMSQKTLEEQAAVYPEAVVEMGKALASKDDNLKEKVLITLGRIDHHAAPALKPLVDVVLGTNAHHRKLAATALGEIGAQAATALNALEKAGKDGIRAAYDARRAILLDMRRAGKKPPPSASYENSNKPDPRKKAPEPVTVAAPKLVKRKVIVLKDGKEVVVSSFMKIGAEYRAKLLDGETKIIPAADVKEVKTVEMEEGKEPAP